MLRVFDQSGGVRDIVLPIGINLKRVRIAPETQRLDSKGHRGALPAIPGHGEVTGSRNGSHRSEDRRRLLGLIPIIHDIRPDSECTE